jgi:GTPase SAR1 family protein
MSKLKITITGPAGSGKSSTAWAVKNALLAYGLLPLVYDDEGETEEVMDSSWRARISSLRGREVEIVTGRREPEPAKQDVSG